MNYELKRAQEKAARKWKLFQIQNRRKVFQKLAKMTKKRVNAARCTRFFKL